jgi:ketosteroid isomerase-like protein
LVSPAIRAGHLLCLALVLACGGSARQTETAAAPERSAVEAAQMELARVELDWGRALQARDTAFFQRTLADEFIATGGPTVLTKRQFLTELGGARPDSSGYRLQDTRVRIYHDVGIVTGLVVYDSPAGQPPSLSRYTEVWVRRDGRWQAVHGHYNAVEPPPPASPSPVPPQQRDSAPPRPPPTR